MARGVYNAGGKCAAVVAAKTLLYLTAPSGKVVEIHSISVTNESNITNFQMQIQVQRITTLGTPTATAVVASPTEPGDQAAGSTIAINVTASEPTYSSNCPLDQQGVSVINGYYYEPMRDADLEYVGSAASIGVRLIAPSSPASTDFDVWIRFREIG